MDKMREEFEAWAMSFKNAHNLPLFVFYKDESGEYTCCDCRVAWSAWKASRAALCVELPDGSCCGFEGDAFNGYMCGVESCKDRLDESGVNHK